MSVSVRAMGQSAQISCAMDVRRAVEPIASLHSPHKGSLGKKALAGSIRQVGLCHPLTLSFASLSDSIESTSIFTSICHND
jgi:hypothetical protein